MIRAFTFMPCSEEEIIDASRTRREKSRSVSQGQHCCRARG